jgi:integrase
MILDHAGVSPNPARDRVTVRLPRRKLVELAPPTADALAAVLALLPSSYRLPVVVLDATGMRVGELEALTWGDVDEPRGRWRVSAETSKTSRPRWVTPPADVFAAVVELVPREDRDLEGLVFAGFAASRLWTAIARGCRAAAVPLFSPYDLRHRRISLLHLGGVPWARIGEAMGQRSLAVTADTLHARSRRRARARLPRTPR